MGKEGEARSAARVRGQRIAASALMMVVILTAGGLVFWRVSPAADAPTGYRAYLDSSGEPVLVVEADNRTPPATVTVATDGFLGTVAALPRDVAGRLVAALGSDLTDVQLERSFSTQVNTDGSTVATTVVSMLGPNGYSVVLSTVSNGGALSYLPPRTELPADPTPGTGWSSRGTANFESPSGRRENRFTYLGSVEASGQRGGRSCVLVLTALDQHSPDGEPYIRTTRSTWCAGRGAVEWTVVETATNSRTAAPGAVHLEPVAAPVPEPLPTGSALPSPLLRADILIPPVVMGGLVISTSGSLGDLNAVRPGPDGQRMEWTQHPGGEILGLAADDSRLFVTTTSPMLTAFDAAGRVHWLTRLPDAAVGAPVTAQGLVVVALLDGTLRAYDAATGEDRWVSRFADVIAVPPVVSRGQTISADLSGLVKAIRLDGGTAWSHSVGPVRAPMTVLADGGVLVQDSGGMLHALDAAGKVRWTGQLDAAVTGEGAVLDAIAALPTGSGVIGVRIGDGSPAWRRDELPMALVDSTGWLAAGNTTGRLTADGRLEQQRQLASEPNVGNNFAGFRPSWPILFGEQALVMQTSGAITALGHV